jgi:F0F1-type ATP synthase assembly protein I
MNQHKSSDEILTIEESDELDQTVKNESSNDSHLFVVPRVKRQNLQADRDADELEQSDDEVQAPAAKRNRLVLLSLIGIAGVAIGIPIGYLLKGMF